MTVFMLVGVSVCVCSRARKHHTHQTPTCTPIILDGLAVKCVMWGRRECVLGKVSVKGTSTRTLTLPSHTHFSPTQHNHFTTGRHTNLIACHL